MFEGREGMTRWRGRSRRRLGEDRGGGGQDGGKEREGRGRVGHTSHCSGPSTKELHSESNSEDDTGITERENPY